VEIEDLIAEDDRVIVRNHMDSDRLAEREKAGVSRDGDRAHRGPENCGEMGLPGSPAYALIEQSIGSSAAWMLLFFCVTLALCQFRWRPACVREWRVMTKRANSKERIANQGEWPPPELGAARFSVLAAELAAVGRGFYKRGWVLGTSGNFSAVVSREPLRLVMTSTGLDKGNLRAAHFLETDDAARVVRGDGRPSAEALLHVEVVRRVKAGAVLHTHSVWSTVLSGAHASQGGVAMEGYEMLKGLEGVGTHRHREWLPILENSQDMVELSQRVAETLRENPGVHGFLLREHGLYTWGASLHEAKRHVEILEFLMEVLVRSGSGSRAI
jgi:methylthioribulose-1-phosphate dehydratase